MIFPNKIRVIILDSASRLPITNIAISIKLFARRKNDYYFIPGITDGKGSVLITKTWLEEEIKKANNMFIMDYGSNLSDCLSKIEIKILNKDEISRAINALNTYKKVLNDCEDKIAILKKAKNIRIFPITVVHDLSNKDVEIVKILSNTKV